MLYKILVIGRKRNQIVASVVDSLQQSNYSVVTKSAIPDNLEGIDLILDVTLKLTSIRSEGLPAIKVVQSPDHLCVSDFDDFLVYPFSSSELLKRVNLCLHKRSDYLRRFPQYLEMISHDVYHPLKAVNFVLGLTRVGNYGDSLEQLRSVLDTSCSTITATLGVLTDLKSELSQQPGGNIEYINIANLLHSIHAQFSKSALAQNINFSLIIEPEVPDVCLYANYSHLWRMVCNLIVNAFKYTPASGSVTIKLDTQVGGFLRLAVQDTGVGITSMQLEQLNIDLGISGCNGTFTLDGTGSHIARAGLGLRTVKYVADCYQASVNVFSQVGEGSTFVIIFNLEANFQCYSQEKRLLVANAAS